MIISRLICCFCWDCEGLLVLLLVLLLYKPLAFLEKAFSTERCGWLLWKVHNHYANTTEKFMIKEYL